MNLPASFTEYTRSLLGDEEYEQLAAAFQQQPPTSIRLNRIKNEKLKKKGADKLGEAAFERVSSLTAPVPWCADGYYLNERLTFTFDPLFHAGYYYVQEASSMFLEQVLRQYISAPVVMLDLCAAPGGKSTHARSLLPEGSLLVANEVMRNRSQILAENLTKWGHPDIVVTNNDPADFSAFPSFFDVILTDVPCSGEGMFRKDPVAVDEWSPANVENCWQRQRRILADIWQSLKPEGLLIYSTCTYNTKEDEENVRWMQQDLGAELLPLPVPDEWNITGNLLNDPSAPVYHFFPHKTRGEGFFLAVLRKPAAEADAGGDAGTNAGARNSFSKNKSSKKKDKASSAVSKEALLTAQSWLDEQASDRYLLLTEGTEIQAFPKRYADELAALKQHLKVVLAGTSLGETKGKDLIPAHALAMSACLLRPDTFATEEISYEQAIAYLRKEAIALPATAPRGYILLTYRHVPLGFVKNIGNRANNLYPSEWRIRSGYLPEEIRLLG